MTEPTGGTFDIKLGDLTRTLPYDATAEQIDAAVVEMMKDLLS